MNKESRIYLYPYMVPICIIPIELFMKIMLVIAYKSMFIGTRVLLLSKIFHFHIPSFVYVVQSYCLKYLHVILV